MDMRVRDLWSGHVVIWVYNHSRMVQQPDGEPKSFNRIVVNDTYTLTTSTLPPSNTIIIG